MMNTKTVKEAADEMGLETYDTALPQYWFDNCLKRNLNPSGHVVWCYDGSLMGYPVALTVEGRMVIGTMAR